jgi:hypothetical protein
MGRKSPWFAGAGGRGRTGAPGRNGKGSVSEGGL